MVLENVFGALLTSPLAELTDDAIKHRLRAYPAKGYACRAETAIRALLNWAADEYKVPNPLAQRRKKIVLPNPPRKVVLTVEHMRHIIAAAAVIGWPGGALIQWLAGTGVRLNELRACDGPNSTPIGLNGLRPPTE
jgi:integrase